MKTDPSRDALADRFSGKRRRSLTRYLLPGESYSGHVCARVAIAYADDLPHAQRLYDYMSRLWFIKGEGPATPVPVQWWGRAWPPDFLLSLNSVGDSLDDIVSTGTENVWLASPMGGGIGTYWGSVRSPSARSRPEHKG